MVRIGVNIPNELMRRLEPLKPELNISQVCREALQAEAENHERMIASLDDDGVRTAVDKVSEQEREFQEAIRMDWEMLGYQDAASWVKAAGWDEWDELLEWRDISKERNEPQWRTLFLPFIDGVEVKVFEDRLGELHNREREMERKYRSFFRWRLNNGVNLDAARQEYMTAWLAYTDAVWKLVEQRREEQYRKLLAQRPAPPQPIIPKHIRADIERNG